jgi:hypothetical protein
MDWYSKFEAICVDDIIGVGEGVKLYGLPYCLEGQVTAKRVTPAAVGPIGKKLLTLKYFESLDIRALPGRPGLVKGKRTKGTLAAEWKDCLPKIMLKTVKGKRVLDLTMDNIVRFVDAVVDNIGRKDRVDSMKERLNPDPTETTEPTASSSYNRLWRKTSIKFSRNDLEKELLQHLESKDVFRASGLLRWLSNAAIRFLVCAIRDAGRPNLVDLMNDQSVVEFLETKILEFGGKPCPPATTDRSTWNERR